MISVVTMFLKSAIRCAIPTAPEWWFSWIATIALIVLSIAVVIVALPSGRSKPVSMLELRGRGWSRAFVWGHWGLALCMLPAVYLLIASPSREVTLVLRNVSQGKVKSTTDSWAKHVELNPVYERVLSRLRTCGATGWLTPTAEIESKIAEECLKELIDTVAVSDKKYGSPMEEERLPLWVTESVQITLMEMYCRYYQRVHGIEVDVARQSPNAGWDAAKSVFERRHIPVKIYQSNMEQTECIVFMDAKGTDLNSLGGSLFQFTVLVRRDQSSNTLNVVFTDSSNAGTTASSATRSVRLTLKPRQKDVEVHSLEAQFPDWSPSYPMTVSDPTTGVMLSFAKASANTPATSISLVVPKSSGVKPVVEQRLSQILQAANQDSYFQECSSRLGVSPITLTNAQNGSVANSYSIYCTNNAIVVVPPGVSFSEIPAESLQSTTEPFPAKYSAGGASPVDVPSYAYRVDRDRERDADSFTTLALPSKLANANTEDVATASPTASIVANACRLNVPMDVGRLFVPAFGQAKVVHPVASYVDIRGQRASILRLNVDDLFGNPNNPQLDISLQRAIARWLTVAANAKSTGSPPSGHMNFADATSPRGRLVLNADALSRLDIVSRQNTDLMGSAVIAAFLLCNAATAVAWIRSPVPTVK